MKNKLVIATVILILIIFALLILFVQPTTKPLVTKEEAITLADQTEEVISWKEQFVNPTRSVDRGDTYWDVSYCSTQAVDVGEIAGSCITARVFDDKTVEVLPILV